MGSIQIIHCQGSGGMKEGSKRCSRGKQFSQLGRHYVPLIFTCGEAGRSRHAQCCCSSCCWGDHFGLPMYFQKRCVQRGLLPCPCALKKGVFREMCSKRCVQRGVFRQVRSERCERTSKCVTPNKKIVAPNQPPQVNERILFLFLI